jgi:hypothetical protein
MAEPARKQAASLYDQDFHAWSEEQGRLLRERSAGLDWDNLAEEIESLGRSDRREIASRMAVLLQHLLKWEAQPSARSASWAASIYEQRHRIHRLLAESPSLRPYPELVLKEEYAVAKWRAAAEAGIPIERLPEDCPYLANQVLDYDFLPGSPG